MFPCNCFSPCVPAYSCVTDLVGGICSTTYSVFKQIYDFPYDTWEYFFSHEKIEDLYEQLRSQFSTIQNLTSQVEELKSHNNTPVKLYTPKRIETVVQKQETSGKKTGPNANASTFTTPVKTPLLQVFNTEKKTDSIVKQTIIYKHGLETQDQEAVYKYLNDKLKSSLLRSSNIKVNFEKVDAVGAVLFILLEKAAHPGYKANPLNTMKKSSDAWSSFKQSLTTSLSSTGNEGKEILKEVLQQQFPDKETEIEELVKANNGDGIIDLIRS